MQINNVSAYNNTSFGMARLKPDGEKLAEGFTQLVDFVDQGVYKKNVLGPVLSELSGKKSSPLKFGDVIDIFKAGDTSFADKNAKFVKNNILKSKKAIDKFFRANSEIKTVGGEKKCIMNENAKALVGELKHSFDINVGNPEFSAKDGSKLLDMFARFLPHDELVPRHSVVTNKIFYRA